MNRPHYEETLPGYYFVTMCIKYRRWLFGRVVDGEVCLSEAGQIAWTVWKSLPRRFPHVHLHEFVVMPNHMHGLIQFTEIGRAWNGTLVPLGQVLRTFKGATTYQIRHQEGKPWFAWQASYWASQLLTEAHVQRVRHYILTNPQSWPQDQLYRTRSVSSREPGW